MAFLKDNQKLLIAKLKIQKTKFVHLVGVNIKILGGLWGQALKTHRKNKKI